MQTAKVVKIYGKTIWIESDFLGGKHVMVQHDAPGETPFRYATFHYDYRHTSNAGTLHAASEVARSLGAQDPIEVRMTEMPHNTGIKPTRF